MGPTASGKSAMGVYLAQKLDAVILNADAMQCYQDLQIITARPEESEMGGVPHHLYGIWSAKTKGNAALWQQAAVLAIEKVHAEGKIPILLGGTGLYVKGLIEGLSPVPPISDPVKQWIRMMAGEDYTVLYNMLRTRDPVMAQKLEPKDTQRILRALEVIQETGRSLWDWQKEEVPPPFDKKQCFFFYVDIDRETLYARIDERFETMVARGALQEVARLREQFDEDEQDRLFRLDYPILKAHGVPELLAHLDGELPLEAAIAKAQRNTRRYAKRQMTWIRGQVEGAIAIPHQSFQEKLEKIAPVLEERLVAAQ